MVLLVYIVAIFTGAGLLFMVQPMAAKLVLPLLGGSPAVWNTTMVFFQALLLGGYVYAHVLSRLRVRLQLVVHTLVLGGAFLLTHIARPTDVNPPDGTLAIIGWQLWLLLATVGAPFFALSSFGPLLQRWFSRTGGKGSHDPYFLYAASNAGSLLGLLAYPVVVESALSLDQQGSAWRWGFAAAAALAIACGFALVRNARPDSSHDALVGVASRELPARVRVFWVLLAFAPSSIMLGATHFITTDLAAVPLFWVVPLALYLVTFILAFSPRLPVSAWMLGLPTRVLIVAMIVAMLVHAREPLGVLVGLHLLTLFVIALMCHRRLYELRPPPERLTEFYFFIAVGGVLGGAFNAVVAPLTFSEVIEYPIALGLACVLIPKRTEEESGKTKSDLLVLLDALPWPGAPESEKGGLIRRVVELLLWPVLILLWIVFIPTLLESDGTATLDADDGKTPPLVLLIAVGIPALLIYLTGRSSLRFGLAAMLAMVAAVSILGQQSGQRVLTERTFFGVHEVYVSEGEHWHSLMHGTTNHGRQSTDPAIAHIPTSYYHPTGPIGEVFGAYGQTPITERVALIGLGAGALAAYGYPGDEFTVYEIDEAVIEIARDSGYFTYLNDALCEIEYVVGDGRLELAKAPDHSYGLIVLDAFSSDAVPVHLLTLEAFEMYRSKLRPNGLIAVHISNRYLKLGGVLGRIGEELGMQVIGRQDGDVEFEPTRPGEPPRRIPGKAISVWVVMAERDADLSLLTSSGNWVRVVGGPDAPLWSDDKSSILPIIQWTSGVAD